MKSIKKNHDQLIFSSVPRTIYPTINNKSKVVAIFKDEEELFDDKTLFSVRDRKCKINAAPFDVFDSAVAAYVFLMLNLTWQQKHIATNYYH